MDQSCDLGMASNLALASLIDKPQLTKKAEYLFLSYHKGTSGLQLMINL